MSDLRQNGKTQSEVIPLNIILLMLWYAPKEFVKKVSCFHLKSDFFIPKKLVLTASVHQWRPL